MELRPRLSTDVNLATGHRHRARRMLRLAKYAAGYHPITLPVLVRATPEGTDRAVRAETDLVVEGFPRSGSTFTVFALRHANPGLTIASHVHHVAQLKLAIRLRRPTVILVREPVACLSSYLLAGPHGLPAGVLREYVAYHRVVADLQRRHPDLLAVVTFEAVTTELTTAVQAISDHFDLTLTARDTPNDVQQVFDRIDEKHTAHQGVSAWSNGVARPDPARSAQLAEKSSALRASANQARLSEASAVHRRLVGAAIS